MHHTPAPCQMSWGSPEPAEVCRFLAGVGTSNFTKPTLKDVKGQRGPDIMMVGDLTSPHSSLFTDLSFHLFM